MGKIAVPARILAKPAALTRLERTLVERHAAGGAELLRALGWEPAMVEAVASHHERLDGSGYPRALRGPAIPLAARIVAVA
ncbi:MAG: HD-GYP domain-containing protein [Gemmatimonadota bacterium]